LPALLAQEAATLARFIADKEPDAYECLVDRLDAAGYLDTMGGDNDFGTTKFGEGKWQYRLLYPRRDVNGPAADQRRSSSGAVSVDSKNDGCKS
jgi:hypothetical protein